MSLPERMRPVGEGIFMLATMATFVAQTLCAEPVVVRYPEGLVHGFLSLSTLEGKILADGELMQTARGDRVTSRLIFRFKDGSSSDETVVFTQSGRFRLVSDHLVQKGPAFDKPMDAQIEASGQVTVRYTDDGKEKVESERMKLPLDLANGLVMTLLKNIDPATKRTTVTMVGFAPKPRLVTLHVEPAGEDPFTFGGASRKATHYIVKVDLGGIAGAVAPLINKQPPDSSLWILGGEAPAFVKSEAPMSAQGPLWRIQLLAPAWPER